MAQFGATQLFLIGLAAAIALPLASRAEPPSPQPIALRAPGDSISVGLDAARASWRAGDEASAARLLVKLRAQAAERGDPAGEIAAINAMAAMHAFDQNFAAAEQARQDALSVARAHDRAADEVLQLSGLAALKVRVGAYSEACALWREADRVAVRAPDLKPAVQSGLEAADCAALASAR